MQPVHPLGFAVASAALLALGLGATGRRPDLVIRFPRTVLLLLLAVSAAAAAALVRLDPAGLRLRIDPSTEPLLPAGDPTSASYAEATRHFGNDEIFVVAMQTDDVFTRENLETLRRVGERISRIEGVSGVQSLMDVYSFRYVPADAWVEVRPFIEEIPADPEALAALRRRALADPIYRRTLVSDDGSAAALNVAFRPMSDAEFIAADLDGSIAAILADETAPGRRFHVAGRPHVKTRVFHLMLRDLGLLLPLALVAMAGAAALAFRSWRGVLLPLGTALLGTLWTFGAVAFLERPLNILTTLLGPTLVVMGCVYGVHVLARYEEDMARLRDPRAAAAASLEHLIGPVLVAGLTTVVGFGALLLTNVPAVFELGAFSVLGIASMTLIALAGLPAALALLPPPRRLAPAALSWSDRMNAALDARLTALARGATRHAGAVIAVFAGVGVLAASAIPRIVVDTDYLSFFDADDPVRRDFEAVDRALAGAVPIYVPLTGAGPGAFRDPDLLGRVERLQARIDEIEGVSRTLSLLDTLRVLNRAIEADDPAQERIPESRAAVTELLFLVPKGELARFTNVDHSRANLVVRTGLVGSAAVRKLTADLEAAVAAAGLPDTVHASVTGNTILLNRSADGIARGQPRTMAATALTIFVLVAWMLRSLRLGIVAMIPNLLPVLCFFGALGWGAAPLSLPTSLIGSVALGIAIDDTAHFLFRYRRERARAGGAAEAVHETGRRVGRPIAITSVMLCAGFGVIGLSGFATLREFGILSAGTMLWCVIADLLLLPALLVTIDPS